jgi:hypothetical protein
VHLAVNKLRDRVSTFKYTIGLKRHLTCPYICPYCCVAMRFCIVVMSCFVRVQHSTFLIDTEKVLHKHSMRNPQEAIHNKRFDDVTVFMQSKHLLSLIAPSQHVMCSPLTTCYYHYLPLLTLQWLFALLLCAYFVCITVAPHTTAPQSAAIATAAVLLCCCCTLYQHCWCHNSATIASQYYTELQHA